MARVCVPHASHALHPPRVRVPPYDRSNCMAPLRVPAPHAHTQTHAVPCCPPPAAAAITATGVIWSRYSTQISPVNYNLLAVNMFMAVTGSYQLIRRIQ